MQHTFVAAGLMVTFWMGSMFALLLGEVAITTQVLSRTF
jgi:hypothetical protein